MGDTRPDDGLPAALAPWRAALGELEAWHAAAGGLGAPEDAARVLHDLHDALDMLGRRACAVPAELPVPAAPLDGWLQGDRSDAARKSQLRRRNALLRLGVWRALRTGPLDTLAARLAGPSADVPPGLAPTLAFASQPKAQDFFSRALAEALAGLGARHGVAVPPLPPYEPTLACAAAWSRAWSAGVAALYADWLQQAAGGDPAAALRLPWQAAGPQWRVPAGLALLPSRERSLHLDLWCDLVLAQALQHDAARFERPAGWHRVEVAMHDLGEQVRGSRTEGAPRRMHRGLRVEMLYQAVFVGRTLAMAGADAAPRPVPVVVELPVHPGQQANFEFIVRWRDGGGLRRTGSAEGVPLAPRKRALLEAWRATQPAVEPRRVDSAIDWRPADAGDVLGEAALWPLVPAAQWLDLALVVCRRGRWSCVPLGVDEAEGSPRHRLAVEAGAPALRAALAQGRGCWVLRPAGSGAFVMLGIDAGDDA